MIMIHIILTIMMIIDALRAARGGLHSAKGGGAVETGCSIINNTTTTNTNNDNDNDNNNDHNNDNNNDNNDNTNNDNTNNVVYKTLYNY